MISFTVNIADAQQLGVAAEALRKMLEALQPPATPPTREDMEAALKTAEQIHTKVAKAPKAKPVQKTETAAPTPAAEEPAPQEVAPATPATESPSEPALTLEAVRAKLAPISQGGKAAAIRDLIKNVGGKDKLSDVPADKYAPLVAAAEAL